MMGELIVRNLIHRPLRTLVGVMAVAVEVALVVLIVGLTSGLLTETAKRIEGIGADIMLQPPAASIFLGFSGSPMPIKIADKLGELKYVQAVAPALLQFNSTGGVDVVYGIDRDSFSTVSGGFVFLEGHDMEGPDDLLVRLGCQGQAHQSGRHLQSSESRLACRGHYRTWKRRAPLRAAGHAAGPCWCARQGVHLLDQMHAAGTHGRRHGPNPPRAAGLHRPAAKGFSFSDDLHEYPRPTNLHQRHDRAGHFDRSVGDFSDDVYDGDRTHAGYRRAQVSWRGPVFHRSRAAHGVRRTLCVWNPCGRRLELCRPRGVSRGIPHVVHSHYAGMDTPRSRNCARRCDLRRELSGLGGQPEGCGGSPLLRLERREISAENAKNAEFTERNAAAANRRERLGTDGNRSYNTDTCRRAVFPGKKERGADTQDRKFVETLPRGQGGCPGSARREFRSPARRIRRGHGSFGLWKVFLALRHRRTGASIPRESPRGRQRFDILE